MKKSQKKQKNLFARICRVLGRFLLATGAVLCVASIIFAASPLLFPNQPENPTPAEIGKITPTPGTAESSVAANPNMAALILPTLIIVGIIILALFVSFRHYNNSIRNAIARIAKSSRLSIHTTELILATIVWAIVNLIIAFNAPVFAILTFTALIFNDLFFIFAWTAYGCPVYTI